MGSPVLSILAASVSFVVYLGYVLLAGTGTFWAFVCRMVRACVDCA